MLLPCSPDPHAHVHTPVGPKGQRAHAVMIVSNPFVLGVHSGLLLASFRDPPCLCFSLACVLARMGGLAFSRAHGAVPGVRYRCALQRRTAWAGACSVTLPCLVCSLACVVPWCCAPVAMSWGQLVLLFAPSHLAPCFCFLHLGEVVIWQFCPFVWIGHRGLSS